ncbi:putative 5-oxoprolinase (ATP-hydrolyzing) [Megalodesulfovibrio gigas DSM 1382 = ATCC 19364]|uniref:Putative 5-oxoprolinase (ATP-hydrolyzing) n=2 Tax=Megalodesulfovibrio gigas TaxID=879 RepID=T2GA79_MEGG1|nr:putative 5-oxoprolinase (ATP-hydrolyzing) [Megalodesulfovibrio gigas DSM 1382 = ATCC 19364]
MHVIGVDTGGTFTDCLCHDGLGFRAHKLLSTPQDPSHAVIEGVHVLASDGVRHIRHGSTVATNALLERRGGPAALIVNAGFEDLLAIGRQARQRLYDLFYRHEPPCIAPAHCFGLPGRLDTQGRELQPLDEAALTRVAAAVQAAGVQAVAVCLLYSFVNPAHELRVAEVLVPLGLPVSLSHRILGEFREYERASATAVNAYVAPKMRRYLTNIEAGLASGDSLRVMQSNGGAITAATARQEPVRTILSGPAGGVVAAWKVGRAAGFDRLLTFDMGGTSTDVSLLHGGLSMTTQTHIAGLPVRIPMLDIHTVGAGGGSIARLDAGGALRVGPESAGADPGPVCYGKGEAMTVTDANCLLGRLLPDYFLGGRMRLDRDRIRPVCEALAAQAGISPLELAEGVLTVANAAMERALRVISVERGHDPQECTLFCFGGAGGLHAAFLAQTLGVPRVLVPQHPGLFSALGMLLADVLKDYSRTVMQPLTADTAAGLAEAFAPLEGRAREELQAEGVEESAMLLERTLDMRYVGQSFELDVVWPDATPDAEPGETSDADTLAAAFHARHAAAYGAAFADRPVEIVTLRLRARGLLPQPAMPPAPLVGETPPAAALLATRPAVFDGREYATAVWQREALQPGNRLPGPAIVVEYSATTVVPPQWQACVDGLGNLLLTLSAEDA